MICHLYSERHSAAGLLDLNAPSVFGQIGKIWIGVDLIACLFDIMGVGQDDLNESRRAPLALGQQIHRCA